MIKVDRMGKSFSTNDSNTDIFNNLSFTIEEGSFVSIVGPSGCGKSSLLQIIGGLIPPSRGRVLLKDTEIKSPPFDMVYVFQQYTKSIFPWKSVKNNVKFGLINRNRCTRAEAEQLAVEYIQLMGLQGFEDHYPWQLSGGMQQRVALARALVCQPSVFMMDEPFSALDAMTKYQLQDLLLEVWKRHKLTVIFVTHDIEEAVYLSERVLVLSQRPGRIIKDVSIDLPYPRNQLATREKTEFLDYRHEIFNLIFEQKGSDEFELVAEN